MDRSDTALSDEFKCERNSAGTVVLKKGPWSEEEDAILKDYVEKHGVGNWNAVPKFSSLLRCGKSCRLRWANHLRPDLKKCPFSPEEDRRIVELHAKLGSKWARMAAELPGRSDNEIKNFWNTRCKRLERNGLPIYPPDVHVEIQTENNQQSHETPPFSNGDIPSSNGFIDVSYHEIEEFKIPQNPILPTYSSPAFLDVPLRDMLPQVPSFSNMFTIFHPQGTPVPSNSGLGESSIASSSFPGQSNRYPNLEQRQLQPHDYNFFEPTTMVELPSIQKTFSNFSFVPHPHPRVGPSTLQSVALAPHHEIDPAEKIITDDFFNLDAAYTQHAAYIPMPSPEYATDAQISAEATDDALLFTDLVSRPTVTDSDKDYTYLLDTSAPNEWFYENIPNLKQELDSTMLDEEMASLFYC